MPDKGQKCDRAKGMAPTSVQVCPATQDDGTVVLEESIMTPLHTRVSACRLQLCKAQA
jgi:hypothetical protein